MTIKERARKIKDRIDSVGKKIRDIKLPQAEDSGMEPMGIDMDMESEMDFDMEGVMGTTKKKKGEMFDLGI